MVQGIIAFAMAALMAVVAISGSQERDLRAASSDVAAQQVVEYARIVD